jgi:hypothetical protein
VEGEFNGFDLVHDVALPGEGNRLQFGNSVRPGGAVFVQEGANLRVTNSGGTDGAVLVDFDPGGIVGSLVTRPFPVVVEDTRLRRHNAGTDESDRRDRQCRDLDRDCHCGSHQGAGW